MHRDLNYRFGLGGKLRNFLSAENAPSRFHGRAIEIGASTIHGASIIRPRRNFTKCNTSNEYGKGLIDRSG